MKKDYKKLIREAKIKKMPGAEVSEVFLIEYCGERYALRKMKSVEGNRF